MKIATTRIHKTALASLAIAATVFSLTACSNNADQSNSSSNTSTAKIGLLLPDSVTARYEAADRPYFEAKISSLCPKCTVL